LNSNFNGTTITATINSSSSTASSGQSGKNC
jgi:hypothetical protein